MYKDEVRKAIENFYDDNCNIFAFPWEDYANVDEFFKDFETQLDREDFEFNMFQKDEATAKANVLADPNEVKDMIEHTFERADCIDLILNPDYQLLDKFTCRKVRAEVLEEFEDSIRKAIEFEIKTARKEDFEMIEEDYCPTSDTTYLMKHTYIKGELAEREVIGFYSGEPHKEATEAYSTVCKGTKATYTL